MPTTLEKHIGYTAGNFRIIFQSDNSIKVSCTSNDCLYVHPKSDNSIEIVAMNSMAVETEITKSKIKKG